MNLLAWVLLVRRVTFAGKSKKVVLMVVSYFLFKLMNEFIPILFTGCCHIQDPAVKEEPKSPSTLTMHKQKVFSTTDSSAIRYITSSDLKCVPVEGTAKHQKLDHPPADWILLPFHGPPGN